MAVLLLLLPPLPPPPPPAVEEEVADRAGLEEAVESFEYRWLRSYPRGALTPSSGRLDRNSPEVSSHANSDAAELLEVDVVRSESIENLASRGSWSRPLLALAPEGS